MKIILDACPAGLALICETQQQRDGATPGGHTMHVHLRSHFTLQSCVSEMIRPSESSMSLVVVVNSQFVDSRS